MDDAYCPKEEPYQIWSQYDLRQRSYKVRQLMSPFQLAKHHGTTSCYREYLSCNRDNLLLSETPFVIETTSCYRKHLLLSRIPLVIGNTSCYRDYLLLSEAPLVIESTSCYRKAFLSDSKRHSFLLSFPVPAGNINPQSNEAGLQG